MLHSKNSENYKRNKNSRIQQKMLILRKTCNNKFCFCYDDTELQCDKISLILDLMKANNSNKITALVSITYCVLSSISNANITDTFSLEHRTLRELFLESLAS